MSEKIEELLLRQENRKYISITVKKRVGEYEQVEVTCSESSETETFEELRRRLKTELMEALKDAVEVYQKSKTETVKNEPEATQKQKELIKRLAPNVNVEGLTITEAKQIIDRLLNERGNKK